MYAHTADKSDEKEEAFCNAINISFYQLPKHNMDDYNPKIGVWEIVSDDMDYEREMNSERL